MFFLSCPNIDEMRNQQYFNTIAPIFDLLYASKDYLHEVNCLNTLLLRWTLKEQLEQILDIGCATGKRTKMLHDLGWKITGLDSAQVICNKVTEKYPDVPIVCTDVMNARHISMPHVDVALAIRGIFIFATSTKHLRQWFQSIHLLNTKIFIIDMPNISDKVINKRKGIFTSVPYEDHRTLITTHRKESSRSRCIKSKRTHTVVDKTTKHCIHYRGTLTMRYHTPKEIRIALSGLFTIKDVWGDYDLRSFNPKSSPRYIVLCTPL